MPRSKPQRRAQGAKLLTETEKAILRALREAESFHVIARALGRSEATVRTHIRNARAKLEIPSTAELRSRLLAGKLDDDVGPSR